MKKLLGIVVLGLLLSGNAYANIFEIESKFINSQMSYLVNKLCIDNKVFIYTKTYQGDHSTALVQMLEERDGKLLPSKC